jgi:hypothetical protein
MSQKLSSQNYADLIAVLSEIGIADEDLTSQLYIPSEIVSQSRSNQKKVKSPRYNLGKVFQRALQKFASIEVGENLYDKDIIQPYLARWLSLEGIQHFLFGIESSLGYLMVPQISGIDKPYFDFLVSVFGSLWKKHSDIKEGKFWSEYLKSCCTAPVNSLPSSWKELHQTVVEQYVAQYRREICPVWPAHAREGIEEKLATVFKDRPRELEAIRRYYGLGGIPETLAVIGNSWNLTQERVRQYRKKGEQLLRRRARSLKILLSPLALPYRFWVERGSSQFPEILLVGVRELAFSIRTENCLHNHNIRFVAELTSYTETQLLKKSGFGRKVLKEIVEVCSRPYFFDFQS